MDSVKDKWNKRTLSETLKRDSDASTTSWKRQAAADIYYKLETISFNLNSPTLNILETILFRKEDKRSGARNSTATKWVFAPVCTTCIPHVYRFPITTCPAGCYEICRLRINVHLFRSIAHRVGGFFCLSLPNHSSSPPPPSLARPLSIKRVYLQT